MGVLFFVVTPSVKAISIQELIDQIKALQAQLATLQSQQGATTAWCHTFNLSLGYANSGSDEVTALHTALQKENISYGSDDSVSYTEETGAAVVQFQTKYGILRTGYVGPKTRAKLNTLYGCSTTSGGNSSSTANATIKVTSPNGGEVWNYGETHDITWTSAGVSTVTLIFSNPNISQTIEGFITASTGKYSWKVPDWLTPGSNYKITIKDQAGQAAADSSDSYFSIGATAGTSGGTSSAQPSIKITSPNGSESWKPGETHDITWTSSGVDNVCISLVKNDGAYGLGMKCVSASLLKYSWTIPANIVAGADYKVWMYSDANYSIKDYSDTYFSIGAPTASGTPTGLSMSAGAFMGTMFSGPTVTVPSGTTLVNINWTSTNAVSCNIVGSPVNVGNGTNVGTNNSSGSTFVVDARNNNTYTLTCSNSAGSASSSITVNISGSTSTAPIITSITQSSASSGLTVIINGSGFIPSSVVAVVNPSIDHPNLSATYISPTQLTAIISAQDNLRVFNIQVFNSNLTSSGSNMVTFTPTVTIAVNSPNGSETWKVGETHDITWTLNGLPPTGYAVNILMTNYTTKYRYSIAPSIPVSQGKYSWTISSDLGGISTLGNQMKMFIVFADNPGAAGGNYPQDESNNYFTVSAAN